MSDIERDPMVAALRRRVRELQQLCKRVKDPKVRRRTELDIEAVNDAIESIRHRFYQGGHDRSTL